MTEREKFSFPLFSETPEAGPIDPDPPWWVGGEFSGEDVDAAGWCDGEWDWADIADEDRDHE